MSHVLAGRLRARCGAGFEEPIANETVLLYWRAEGDPDGFTLRTHEQAREREYLLLAQGRTDSDGNFRIDIGGDTLLGHRGSRRLYEGGLLGLEVFCRGSGSAEGVQFRVGTVQPDWQGGGDAYFARLDRDLDESAWAQVRRALDLWTIVGRVMLRTGSPAAGYTVFAHDCDALRDDFLGSALVAADGSFRIDYPGSAFHPGRIARIDLERGGPEVYFHVQAQDGTVIYEEASSRGICRDRANSPNWVDVELTIDKLPELAGPRPPTAM